MKLASEDSDASRTFREELFGSDLRVVAPDLYNIVDLLRTMNVSYDLFLTWDIHNQAIQLAQFQLAQMLDVIRKNDDIMKRRNEKLNQKSKGSKKR